LASDPEAKLQLERDPKRISARFYSADALRRVYRQVEESSAFYLRLDGAAPSTNEIPCLFRTARRGEQFIATILAWSRGTVALQPKLTVADFNTLTETLSRALKKELDAVGPVRVHSDESVEIKGARNRLAARGFLDDSNEIPDARERLQKRGFATAEDDRADTNEFDPSASGSGVTRRPVARRLEPTPAPNWPRPPSSEHRTLSGAGKPEARSADFSPPGSEASNVGARGPSRASVTPPTDSGSNDAVTAPFDRDGSVVPSADAAGTAASPDEPAPASGKSTPPSIPVSFDAEEPALTIWSADDPPAASEPAAADQDAPTSEFDGTG